MEHEKVRQLVMDLAAEVERGRASSRSSGVSRAWFQSLLNVAGNTHLSYVERFDIIQTELRRCLSSMTSETQPASRSLETDTLRDENLRLRGMLASRASAATQGKSE